METKPTAAVLHTRNARGRGGINATESALEYATTLPDVTVTPGKEVVEFSVVHTSKGVAVDALARASASDAWLYLGDDVTDESVFAAAEEQDVTLKVGGGEVYLLGNGYAPVVTVKDADGKVLHTELVPEITQEPDYDAAVKALG